MIILVIQQHIYERYRRTIREVAYYWVRGKVQKRDAHAAALSILVGYIEPLSRLFSA